MGVRGVVVGWALFILTTGAGTAGKGLAVRSDCAFAATGAAQAFSRKDDADGHREDCDAENA